jgi:hypothetical protein
MPAIVLNCADCIRSPSLALLQSCALLISADAFILQHTLRLLAIYLDCSYIAWFTYGVYGVLIMCAHHVLTAKVSCTIISQLIAIARVSATV